MITILSVDNLVKYIIIGAILAFISDMTMRFVIKKPELEFTNVERFAIIALWPLYLIIILFGNIKSKK